MLKINPRWLNRAWFLDQVKNNSVALISLVTAISGITYNTWRDHQNAMNDNMRDAAFVVLDNLGELQTIINYAHFEQDAARGNPIDGWKHAVMIRDVSHLLPQSAQKTAEQLYLDWQNNWEYLGKDANAEALVSNSITKSRQAVLETVNSIK